MGRKAQNRSVLLRTDSEEKGIEAEFTFRELGVGLSHFCVVMWAPGNGLALDLGPTWRLWLYLHKPG